MADGKLHDPAEAAQGGRKARLRAFQQPFFPAIAPRFAATCWTPLRTMPLLGRAHCWVVQAHPMAPADASSTTRETAMEYAHHAAMMPDASSPERPTPVSSRKRRRVTFTRVEVRHIWDRS